MIEISEEPASWPLPRVVEETSYKAGGIMKSRDVTTSIKSNFVVPTAKFSRTCVYSPVKFIVDEEHACILKNTKTNCENTAVNYDHLANIEIDGEGVTLNYIQPVFICQDADNNSITCVSSTHDGSQCINAATKSEYILSTNTNGFVEQVNITLTLETVSTSKWISHETQLLFMRETVTRSDIEHFSGRPGYLLNKPIRLANYDPDENFITTYNISELRIMSHKQCSDVDAVRDTAYFGNDQFVNCVYTTTKTCEDAQGEVDLILDGNTQATVVGHWGDSFTCNPCITDDLMANKWTTMTKKDKDFCADNPLRIVTGKHYTIFFQNTGNILDPQPKIVGLQVSYDSATEGDTIDGTEYKFRISSSVVYVDVSSKPEKLFAQPPKVNVELPSSFFHPFK